MRTKTGPNGPADKHVNEIKRKTRRQFSAEEKIRIVLDGLRWESSISELCRRECISESFGRFSNSEDPQRQTTLDPQA
jgi:transposase